MPFLSRISSDSRNVFFDYSILSENCQTVTAITTDFRHSTLLSALKSVQTAFPFLSKYIPLLAVSADKHDGEGSHLLPIL